MASVTLYPTDDAHVDSGNPTTNYGTATNLELSATKRAWVKFDLSSIPANSFITSAVLTWPVYIGTPDYSATYVLKRATGSWAEGTITWNNAPNSTVSSTVSAYLYNASQTEVGLRTMTVTADVNDVMVEANTSVSWRMDGDVATFQSYSSESGQNLLKLVVTYVAGTTTTYTANDTWTCPAGVTAVDVYAIGGGGGGGGGGILEKAVRAGSGGGGGAYSKKIGYTVTPTTGYTVSVGTAGGAGAAGDVGTAGGDTYFNTTGVLLAKGGSAGSEFTGGAGGASGSGVGDIKYSGGAGGNRVTNTAGAGGSGAGTVLVGGTATTAAGTAGDFFGGLGGVYTSGDNYGGAGAGGVWFSDGYDGAAGIILIHYASPTSADSDNFFMFM